MRVFHQTLRRMLWGLAALLLLAVALVWGSWEPSYQGKSLSAWAYQLMPPYPPDPLPADHPQAVAAMRHFGARALPLALDYCVVKEPWLRGKLLVWLGEEQCREYAIFSVEDRHRMAFAIFEALGTNAQPAVPVLLWRLERAGDETADSAGAALACIGSPETVPPLIQMLSHPSPTVRVRAAMALWRMGPLAHAATPTLLRCLHDPDAHVRGGAASALGQVSDDPEVIDALLRCLRDPQFGHNDYAAAALGNIHKEPEIVVSALLDYLSTRTNEFSLLTVGALRQYGTNAQPWAPRLAAIIQTGQFGNMTPVWLYTLAKIDPHLAAPMLAAWEQDHPPPPSPPPPPDDGMEQRRRGLSPPAPMPPPP